MKNIKYFLFIIFFILSTAHIIFSETILLKDGIFFNGKLISIDNQEIIFQNEKEFLRINYHAIDYLIPDSIDEDSIKIQIENDNFKRDFILVKISETIIICSNNNEIYSFNTNELKSISLQKTNNLENKIIKYYQYTDKYVFNIVNFEILVNKLIINNSIDPKKVEFQKFDIHDVNFYEKFWNNIYLVIKNNTKDLLWELLIQYFDNEKNLNLIYSEYIQNTDKNNIEKINKINKELNNKIVQLRIDFYKRVLKIIFRNEYKH